MARIFLWLKIRTPKFFEIATSKKKKKKRKKIIKMKNRVEHLNLKSLKIPVCCGRGGGIEAIEVRTFGL